jgi:small subunit ribosomal protein S15
MEILVKFSKYWFIWCVPMLKTQKKKKIIEEYKVHEADTGSAQVQVAILSEQIKQLTGHLKKHPKDNHSRYGLLKMVTKRKKFLDFLNKGDEKSYHTLVKKLDLKK